MWLADKNAQHKIIIGKWGENQAVAFLMKKGYFILARNFRCKNDEVDIIAWDQENEEVVFVEVKTRQDVEYGTASEAVDRRKLHAQARIAADYMHKKQIKKDYRFDIITVTQSSQKIEHFENVSWLF